MQYSTVCIIVLYLCLINMSSGYFKFPHEITLLDSNTSSELLQYYKGAPSGYVQVGPEKYFFPQKYQQEAEGYYNFDARPNDIWVSTFPRSGTTWTQELVWLVANNLDFETAGKRLLTERFPFFEFPIFVHPDIKAELLRENAGDTEKLQFIEQFSRPGYDSLSDIDTTTRRFIKTHFPFSLLPPSVMKNKCKLIYVARNPKDVAISYFHLNRLYRTQGYMGDFPRFWSYFEKNLNAWMPYHSHIREALAHQHFPNVLFLNYEDMVKDLRATIIKVSKFLECPVSEEGLEKLVNHLHISNFRNNTSVNGHEMEWVGVLRKGEAGFVRMGGKGTQAELAENPDLELRINKWIKENENKIFE